MTVAGGSEVVAGGGGVAELWKAERDDRSA